MHAFACVGYSYNYLMIFGLLDAVTGSGFGIVLNLVCFLLDAQGCQWEKASEVFAQMQQSGCRPDVVTYTALIGAYEQGGQWLKALQAFQQMQSQGCEPDAILYNALLDVLWQTGIRWAQRKAAQLFRSATQQGHFRQLPALTGAKLELGLQGSSAGVAMLTLHCCFADLR